MGPEVELRADGALERRLDGSMECHDRVTYSAPFLRKHKLFRNGRIGPSSGDGPNSTTGPPQGQNTFPKAIVRHRLSEQ
jgi:hypothetical protein